jgi:hypothetical protein
MSNTAISSYEPPDRRTMKQRLQYLLDSQPNLMEEICQRVAGGESLQEIAKNEMVPVGRFLLWIQSNPENFEQYKAACRIYADSLVHRGLKVGRDQFLRNDDGSLMTDEHGRPFEKDVQWARLESNNDFKAAKMLDPDRFADRAPKIDAAPVSSEGVAELARIVGNALEKRNRLPGAMDPTPQDAEILRPE